MHELTEISGDPWLSGTALSRTESGPGQPWVKLSALDNNRRVGNSLFALSLFVLLLKIAKIAHMSPHPRDPFWRLASRDLIALFGS